MRKFRPILLAAALVGNLMAFDAVLFPMVAFSESLLSSCPTDETALWTNCRGTRPYPDGGEYVGEFRDGKPNGQGTLTYRYWGEYVGEFRDGRPNGQGTYTYPDGRRYVGEWRDGDFNGRGTRTYPDGRKEVGEWRDGNFIGQGTPNEENLSLLIQIVLLVIGAAIVTVYVIKAKRKPAVTPLISTSTHIGGPDEQSRVEDFQSVLLEAVEDFSIPDDKLLELRENARREFKKLKELNRKGAMKRFFDFLKFW